jgi:hypothetical protein
MTLPRSNFLPNWCGAPAPDLSLRRNSGDATVCNELQLGVVTFFKNLLQSIAINLELVNNEATAHRRPAANECGAT